MNFRKILRKVFFENAWHCAYRNIYNQPGYPGLDGKFEYSLVKFDKNHWAADAFVFCKNDEPYLFCEYFDCKRNKAVIAAKQILSGNIPAVIYEFPNHVSYPCIFNVESDLYIIPETMAQSKLQILKCTEWPFKWEFLGNLETDCKYVDSTFFLCDNTPSIFLYEPGINQSNLFIATIDLKNIKLLNKSLLCTYDRNHGRPAGKVFEYYGLQIRPVQPSINYYGEKIEYYSFSLKNGFSENKIGECTANDIKIRNLKSKSIIGIHTINRFGNIEVIDVLTSKFNIFKPLIYLLKKSGFFGFGFYEYERKYIYKEFEQ